MDSISISHSNRKQKSFLSLTEKGWFDHPKSVLKSRGQRERERQRERAEDVDVDGIIIMCVIREIIIYIYIR